MKLFSVRKGLKKRRTQLQVDEVDEQLRNRLWNVFKSIFWDVIYRQDPYVFRELIEKLWDNYFKRPTDTIPTNDVDCYNEIRNYFFECEWYEVYKFLEFIVENSLHLRPGVIVNSPVPIPSWGEAFKNKCNIILEEELSAYRFVGNLITQITTKEEISEIEEALENPLKNVRQHIETALKLLSDKKNPDYRNSIKESISAVEAMCKLIAKSESVTLGEALNIIKNKGNVEIHPALLDAFNKLYGYTSSADGIRHALTNEKVKVGFEEAKFMLVMCSAFTNYLKYKAKNLL